MQIFQILLKKYSAFPILSAKSSFLSKMNVWGIFPTWFLLLSTIFYSELKNSKKHGIFRNFRELALKQVFFYLCQYKIGHFYPTVHDNNGYGSNLWFLLILKNFENQLKLVKNQQKWLKMAYLPWSWAKMNIYCNCIYELKSFNSNFLFLKFFHNSFIFQNKFTVNWISKMLESQVGKRNLLSELTGVILKCSECDDNCEWIKLWRFDFLFFEIHLVLTKKFKIKCWSLYFTNQRFYKILYFLCII